MSKRPSNAEKLQGPESTDLPPDAVNDGVVHRILSALFSKRTGPLREDEVSDNAIHQALDLLYRKKR